MPILTVVHRNAILETFGEKRVRVRPCVSVISAECSIISNNVDPFNPTHLSYLHTDIPFDWVVCVHACLYPLYY